MATKENRERRCEITVTALTEEGFGAGVVGDVQVLVRDVLPGETATVEIAHASPHRRIAWAELVRRHAPDAAARRAPTCQAFGACGGCAWQHWSYASQLTAKRARIVDAFAAYPAVAELEVPDVQPAPAQRGYRNKGKYVVAGRAGAVVLGAYRPRSHDVISTLGCAIVDPVIDEVAHWVQGACNDAGVEPYHEGRRHGDLRYVVIRSNRAGDVLVALVHRATMPGLGLTRIAQALARHPAVVSVVSLANDRTDGAIVPVGAQSRVLHGTGQLTETLVGATIAVGPAEFLQVNIPMAEALYRYLAAAVVATAAAPNAPVSTCAAAPVAAAHGAMPTSSPIHALDVYSGVGGVALALAAHGVRVTALELEHAAVTALARVAEREALAITAVQGNAAMLRTLSEGQGAPPPAIVIVNPPRKGLDDATREGLLAVAPRCIGYVSCGPQSLARDLAVLLAAGYTVVELAAFDLMPDTAQVETVVILRRGPPAPM